LFAVNEILHKASHDWSFKESELVVEEEIVPKEGGKKKERSEKEKLAEYEKLVAEGKAGSLGNESKIQVFK